MNTRRRQKPGRCGADRIMQDTGILCMDCRRKRRADGGRICVAASESGSRKEIINPAPDYRVLQFEEASGFSDTDRIGFFDNPLRDCGNGLPHYRRCQNGKKKVTGYIKLQIPAGKATPAPPVGPALGQHGVNIVEFTKQFNARTADKGDVIIPVVITVYADRSFSFITKTPPAAVLLKKACNLKSGSAVPNKTKVATLPKAKLQEIAEMKMPDLNAASLEAAMSMIAGTARSMGITIEE